MPKDIESIFYSDIKQILQTARKRAYATVNRAMVEAYWLIGKRIVEEEQDGETRAKYGKKTLESLSKSLTHEFGKGFSYANLRNFRQFYLTYPDKKICDTVCSKLSWSHNRLIMRIDNLKTRNYYLTEAVQQQWSVRHLQRNINTLYYERLLSSQHPQSTPENQADTEKINQRAFIKDPYVLEFLQLSDDKKHQDIGQMDTYVRMFDEFKRGNDDNPTVGLILCTSKDETIVKFSVLKESHQLFASKYRLLSLHSLNKKPLFKKSKNYSPCVTNWKPRSPATRPTPNN